jgi:hypothetical protein
VTTGIVIVGDISSKYPTEGLRTQDDYVIQAFSTKGAYQAFDVGRLPGRSRGSEDFGDMHGSCLTAERVSIDPVTVAQKVAGRRIPRKCLPELCGRPFRGWMFGHIEMQNTPAVMSQNQKDKQKPEINGRHDEEVD